MTCLEISTSKTKTMEIPHEFFMNTPGNSTSSNWPLEFSHIFSMEAVKQKSKTFAKHLHVLGKRDLLSVHVDLQKGKKILPSPHTRHTSLPKSHPQLSAKLPKISWDFFPPLFVDSMAFKVQVFFEKKLEKKHLCYHYKNYCYFCKLNITVINLIVDFRNMIKLSKNMRW